MCIFVLTTFIEAKTTDYTDSTIVGSFLGSVNRGL